jgi:hypothetical protein
MGLTMSRFAVFFVFAGEANGCRVRAAEAARRGTIRTIFAERLALYIRYRNEALV